MKNFYKVLGVPQDADEQTLTTAAIALAEKYKANPTPENQEKFAEVETAFEVLGSPELRRNYDAQLSRERERDNEVVACPYCGEKILAVAVKCKHCGSDMVQVTEKKESNWSSPLSKSDIIIAVIVVTVFSAYKIYDNKPAGGNVDLDASARGACMEFIKTQLHDPSSAEFFHSSEASVIRSPDGSWTVIRSVRAKNLFNATRLTTFQCNMQYSGGKWTAQEVRQVD